MCALCVCDCGRGGVEEEQLTDIINHVTYYMYVLKMLCSCYIISIYFTSYSNYISMHIYQGFIQKFGWVWEKMMHVEPWVWGYAPPENVRNLVNTCSEVASSGFWGSKKATN